MQFSSETSIHFPNRKRTLVVMAKAPRPGTVKTRLSQNLPPQAVTALYRCLLEDTITLARSLAGIGLAVMCPQSDSEELADLLGDTVEVVAQKGVGLAAGLISVFADFTPAGEQVIAFNSDSPHLSPSVLESAFRKLDVCDLVAGPTHDGGYYLVGAKAAHPTLFENDGLGTRTAFERLFARARILELSTSLTETFYDIDVAEDLIRLDGELRVTPAKAPRTASWLADWREAVASLSPATEKL